MMRFLQLYVEIVHVCMHDNTGVCLVCVIRIFSDEEIRKWLYFLNNESSTPVLGGNQHSIIDDWRCKDVLHSGVNETRISCRTQ